MNNQTVQQVRKPIYCKWCGTVELTFDPNRKNKAGTKMLPIEVASGIVHSCTQSPYALNKSNTDVKSAAPTNEKLVGIREIELNLLTQKVDLIVKQMSALLAKYDVTVDKMAPVEL